MRLLVCLGNAAVWMAVCQALDSGFFASLFAGGIGFAAVAMILGISMRPEDAAQNSAAAND
jgi:hypothetical protein